jgi:mono/diheme cytochrome c family protein
MTMTRQRQRWSLGLAAAIGMAILAMLVPARLVYAQTLHELSLPDNPLQGRVLFASRHCHQCHGFADGRTGIGPSLGDGHFAGTFLELGAALWNHVPGMSVTFDVTGVPWPRLSDEETVELVVFMNFIDYLGRPGRSEVGEQIFESNGCHNCHSVGGGEAHRGPDLAELEYFASPLYLAQRIWNHGPSMLESMREMGMPPPSFEDGDLADISAYVRQRAAPGPREAGLAAPGNPNRGADLFSSKGCSMCHGQDGRGGPSGPNLGERDLHRSAEGIAGVMWNHALAMSETMRSMGIGWPEFQDSEMADLVSFLYFLPFDDPVGDPDRGAAVFRKHACVECHGEVGSEGEAPSLEESSAGSTPSSLVAAMWNHAPTMKTAILGEGRRWPQLTGQDLRDLLALFEDTASIE